MISIRLSWDAYTFYLLFDTWSRANVEGSKFVLFSIKDFYKRSYCVTPRVTLAYSVVEQLLVYNHEGSNIFVCVQSHVERIEVLILLRTIEGRLYTILGT